MAGLTSVDFKIKSTCQTQKALQRRSNVAYDYTRSCSRIASLKEERAHFFARSSSALCYSALLIYFKWLRISRAERSSSFSLASSKHNACFVAYNHEDFGEDDPGQLMADNHVDFTRSVCSVFPVLRQCCQVSKTSRDEQ